ncbi:MAG: flippase [Deltaproteobacteria bacterium]|nr:flippase [Deltaproteobacteria bacterium]
MNVIKGSSAIFFLGGLSSLFGLFIRITLARELSLEAFGLFYAGLAFISLVGLLKNMGLNQALVKYIPEYLVQGDFKSIKISILIAATSSLLTSIMVAGLTLLVLGPLAEHYFHIALAEKMVPILLVYLVISALIGVINGVFHGFKKPFFMTAEQLSLHTIILASLILFDQIKIMDVCWIYVFSAGVVFLGCAVALFRLCNIFLYRGYFSKKILKRMIGFGLPVTATTITNKTLGSGINSIMLTYFQNVVEVGIFNVAAPFARIFISIGSAVGKMMFPYSSELLYRKESGDLRSMIRYLQKALFFFMVPGAVFFMLTAPYFIPLIFGKQFHQGVLAAQILILGGVLQAISLININVIKGIGHPLKVARISLISGLVNFSANLILIPVLSFEGAALGTVLGYTATFFLSNYYLRVSIHYPSQWAVLFKVMSIGIALFIAGLWISGGVPIDNMMRVIILWIILTVLYVSLCLMIQVISFEEMKHVTRLIVSRFLKTSQTGRYDSD